MKKLIFAFLLGILLTSCSKDLDDTETVGLVYGVVSDAQTGEPIANVSVTLYEGLAWDCLGASVGTVFTGSDGFYQIVNIDPSKSYFIGAEHSGYRHNGHRATVQAGKKTEINIALSKK